MISVIIPTFNRKDVIMKSINSVLKQTYQDIELIVVDDCSDDGTVELLSQIQDSRFRLEKLSVRSGAPAARNHGVRVSKGEYIAFQDSDDIWMAEKLDKQIEFLQKTDADMVGCNFCWFTDKETLPFLDDENKKKLDVNTSDLIPANFISTQTMFGKRTVFENIPFREDMPRLQDWMLALEITRRYRVCFDHCIMAQVSAQGKDRISNKWESYQIAIRKIVDWILKEYISSPEEMHETVEKLFDHYAMLASQPSDILMLKEKNLELCNTLNSVMNSNSWRITKPLRSIMGIIKRI